MDNIILDINNVSKQYRLGEIGTGSLTHDVNRWWHKVRGKEDPYLKIGETNDRTKSGVSDYVWALKDVNLKINQGDSVGIIGRNGAGKSTLLKLLSKITKPTTGVIRYGGRIASLLEVGTGFHQEMTGRENVYLSGAILGMNRREIKSKFDEIVEYSGVERYIDTPVKRYSSGMYVRLAFAVAAFLESDILIVDEVLAVGDAEFQNKCVGKMGSLTKGEGRTVLFVSHNMGSVKSLCNKGVFMNKGTVEYSGDINSAIHMYLQDNIENTTLSAFSEFKDDTDLPFVLESVRLILNGKPTDNPRVDFNDKIGFEIIAKVKKEVKNRVIKIRCKNEFGTFMTNYDLSNTIEVSNREKGIYRILVEYPVAFFKEGFVNFDFEIDNYKKDLEIVYSDAIQLEVDITSRKSLYQPFFKGENGLIYIEPIFKTEKIG